MSPCLATLLKLGDCSTAGGGDDPHPPLAAASNALSRSSVGDWRHVPGASTWARWWQMSTATVLWRWWGVTNLMPLGGAGGYTSPRMPPSTGRGKGIEAAGDDGSVWKVYHGTRAISSLITTGLSGSLLHFTGLLIRWIGRRFIRRLLTGAIWNMPLGEYLIPLGEYLDWLRCRSVRFGHWSLL